ncbi:MAG: hypothetical protein ACR2MD_14285 [Aridibacter sp.]|jgi:hypothetical protein|nr:hypothetical protein [Acidobacteriota bacterium]
MSSSIYHFFKDLAENRNSLKMISKLDDFSFDENLLSFKRAGQFPDLAIRICKDDELFTGGELIELKDSKSYTVSSFNSTIPTGEKEITQIIKSENSAILQEMKIAGDDVYSMSEREVFYLIRGKKKEHCKIVLVHGSFFETVKVSELITKSFSQVLQETIKNNDLEIDEETVKILESLFSEQTSFSKVRNVEKASVKLRFRIMTEVKAEGNILNTKKYPQISDNTLNLVFPSKNADDDQLHFDKMSVVFGDLQKFEIFHIKHHFNGNFLIFQLPL